MQNELCATSDKNTNFNISKHLPSKVEISNSLCSRTVQFTIFKRQIKSKGHTYTKPMICLPWACHGRAAVWFPANNSHMCCVELALKAMCHCFREPIKTFFLRRLSYDFQIACPALVSGLLYRKPCNKPLTSLVFSVRTVNYRSSNFSIELWPARLACGL